MSLSDELAAQAAQTPEARRKTLGALADLLERSGIDVADIGSVRRINAWQALAKNADGEPELHDLVGIQFAPTWESGPEWPVIQPAAPVRLPAARKAKARQRDDGWETCVVLPDIQIGYYRTDDGWEPVHDEQAMAVAVAVVAAARPDRVVLLGDTLDLVEQSRYRRSPAWAQSSQRAIDRATLLAAELRHAAGDACRIEWLAGNHDERMALWVLDNAAAAFGLRQGKAPDSWPVLSIPHLCRLDDFGVSYLPGYPASEVWLNDALKIVHGDLVRGGGQNTAHAYLRREHVSVIYGHIHRRELAEVTWDHRGKVRTLTAVSPGTLSRIDGAVPSAKGGMDLDGRPVRKIENWAQGLAVVEYDPSGTDFAIELVAISAGEARWRGKTYA